MDFILLDIPRGSNLFCCVGGGTGLVSTFEAKVIDPFPS